MSKRILDEAKAVIADRRERVDGPEGNFKRIAQIWSVVFGHEVTARDVALCMIGLKFARECFGHWKDNLVDLAGYADCLSQIEGDYGDALETCDPVQQAKDYIAKHPEISGPAQPQPAAMEYRRTPAWEPPRFKAWGTHDSGP